MKYRRGFVGLTAIFTMATGVAAQTMSNCRPGHGPTQGVLGIGTYHCVGGFCWIHDFPDSAWFQFSSEPRLRDLVAGGSAAQAGLRDGDVLVALDALPIVTVDAGRRLANLRPGTAITLTVRRNGRVMDVTVTPAAGCGIPGLAVTPTDEWPPQVFRDYAMHIKPPRGDSLSIKAPRIGSDTASGGLQRRLRVGDVDVSIFGLPVRVTTDPVTGELVITTITNVLRLRPHTP